jgi:hypothetical protein
MFRSLLLRSDSFEATRDPLQPALGLQNLTIAEKNAPVFSPKDPSPLSMMTAFDSQVPLFSF